MTKQDNVVEGFSLSGDEVFNMKDTNFTIDKEPTYKELPDMNDPTKTIKIMVIEITLANGITADWNANKTSQKVLIAQRGRILKDWIGFAGELDAVEQQVGPEKRKVIYLKA